MNLLVAIDMAACSNFAEALKMIWDSGDAALPIDQRLPIESRQKLAVQLKASSVIDKNLERISLSNAQPVEQGDALVIATSGSTGDSKGVVHTHGSIRAAIMATGERLKCSSHDHWLACISLAHVGGLSVVVRALHFGSTLSITDRSDQREIDIAVKNGATMTSLVPTSLQRLDVTNFRAVLVGGSQISGTLPPNAISTYGLTETMGGVVYNSQPLGDVEIKISDDSEIFVRTKSLLRCYRDGTDPKTTDGWLPTGDLGEMQEGKLAVHGRKDDLIKTGGFKVWPKSVEDVILNIDGVSECVVRGVPDDKWGSAVSAWIVLDKSRASIDLKTVRSFVKQSLPDYCAPKIIINVSEIPRTALGKVRIAELLNLKSLNT